MRIDGKNAELWARIRDFKFDEGEPSLTFVQRLARENCWSLAFAQRVLSEYRKFLFLAVAAGHPVTPSDEVDQAWHQHLTYSRSYWEELCPKILGRPLHHGPTRGGTDEDTKYHDWYGKTLASYERLFGIEPPIDIWPPSAIRFASADVFRRVDSREHWVVPKRGMRAAAMIGMVLAGGLAAFGCAQAAGSNSALVIIIMIVVIAAMIALVAMVMKSNTAPRKGVRKWTDSSGASGGCAATGAMGGMWAGGGHARKESGSGCGGGEHRSSSSDRSHDHGGNDDAGGGGDAGGGDGGGAGCGSGGCGGGGCGGS